MPLRHPESHAMRQALDAPQRSTSRLRVLTRLNQAISSSLHLGDVLGRIAAAAADLTESPVVELWIADEAAQRLRLCVGSDAVVGDDTRPCALPYGREGAGWVATHRCRLDVPDIYGDDRIQASQWFKTRGLTSGLWLPIVFENRLLGVLALLHRRPFRLQADETELLESFVGHAAIAIRNARLFEESETRRRGAEALAEVGRELSQALEPDVVAQRIADNVCGLLKVQCSALFRLESKSGDLIRLAVSGDAARLGESVVFPQGSGVIGVAARERTVVVTPDLLTDARVTLTPDMRGRIEATGYRAVLAVPLIVRDRVIGVLAVGDAVGRVFDADDIRLGQMCADQAALALRNAELYRSAQTRLARMRRLTELSQLVTSSLDLQNVLEFATKTILDLLDVELARLWVVDEAAGLLRLAAQTSRSPDAAPGTGRTEMPLGAGAMGWVVEHRTKRYCADVAEDPIRANGPWFKARGYVSQIAVPLVVGERALGALSVMTKTRRVFSEEEQELLELFAAKAATALEHAQLYADRQAQTAALQAKNSELDSFVYSVSHDLKAPLVTMQGMAGLLLQDYAQQLDARGVRYLERLQANVEQMERLISDLLALSRVGREARAPEAINLTELVDALMAEIDGVISARGAKVIVRDPVTLWGVRTQIQQVLGNLVGNAIKYVADQVSPVVEIGGVDRGEFVECYVKDNGIGIDPAYHTKIFEMFQRLKEVESEGTGIGLAIVKKIVESAGGRVWVESAQGHGSTFRFTSPKRPDGAGG